jgi:hypothetical protein
MRFRAAAAMRAAEGQQRASEVSGPQDRPNSDGVRSGESLRATRWAVRVTKRNVRLCYANLDAQAALLAVSLAALAYGRDLVPPWLAIVVAVVGRSSAGQKAALYLDLLCTGQRASSSI